MIGHQAVGVNFTIKMAFEFDEIFAVVVVVVIRDENSLAVMTLSFAKIQPGLKRSH